MMEIKLNDAYSFGSTLDAFNHAPGIDKISDTKFIFCYSYRAYHDQRFYVCIGNISNGVISYGPASYISTSWSFGCKIKYIGGNTCLFVYNEWDGNSTIHTRANLLTFDENDNISFSTSINLFTAPTGYYLKKVELLSPTLFAIVWGSNQYNYVNMFKIDGSTISKLSGQISAQYYPTILKLNSNQIICSFDYVSGTKVQIMTETNDVLSLSNALSLQTGYFASQPSIARINDTQFLVYYNIGGGAKAKICTISDNVITAGSEMSVNIFKYGETFQLNESNFLVYSGNNLYTGNIGTSLTIENETPIASSISGQKELAFLDEKTFVIIYGYDDIGYVKSGTVTESLSSSNFFLFFN